MQGLGRPVGARDLRSAGYLSIERGDFAVVTVREEIALGPQHAGRFGLRSKYARKGLIATMGPQIDPGFHGRLILGLTNLTPKAITVPHLAVGGLSSFFSAPPDASGQAPGSGSGGRYTSPTVRPPLPFGRFSRPDRASRAIWIALRRVGVERSPT